jgi:hypothetical protein
MCADRGHPIIELLGSIVAVAGTSQSALDGLRYLRDVELAALPPSSSDSSMPAACRAAW